MHPLDPRGVRPDLEHRLGERHIRDRPGIDLECEGLPRSAILCEVVRAKGRPNRSEEGPEDTVVVEAEHAFELALNLCHKVGGGLQPRVLVPRVPTWVELSLEELNEKSNDPGITSHDPLDVLLAERGSDLPEIAGIRSNERGLPPGESGADDECIERIRLALTEPRRTEGIRRADRQRLPLLDVAGGQS